MNRQLHNLNLTEQISDKCEEKYLEIEQKEVGDKQKDNEAAWCLIAPSLVRLFDKYGFDKSYDVSYQDIDKAVGKMISEYQELLSAYNRIRERNKEYRQIIKEIEKIYGSLPKQKKQGGRKKKEVDWEKYDLLKQAGLSEKQIAEYMKIGVSTLRKYRANRSE